MSNNLINEVSRMKDLFGYKKGQVISEQKYTISEQVDVSKLPLGTEGNFLDMLKSAGINGNQDPNFNKYYEWNDAIGSYYKRQTPLSTPLKPTMPSTQPKTTTPQTQKTFIKPKELKDIKSFHNWLDKTHPGWHPKYKTLNGDPNKGFGKYGPNTQSAWNKYGKEFLSGGGMGTVNAPTNKIDITKDLEDYLKMPTTGTADENHGKTQTSPDVNNTTMTQKWDGFIHNYVLGDWWDKKFNQDGTVKVQNQSQSVADNYPVKKIMTGTKDYPGAFNSEETPTDDNLDYVVKK